MNEPHQHRQVAEPFGSDAERYDRARPSYPGALVEAIVAGSPGVLDVGCGTGIAARRTLEMRKRLQGYGQRSPTGELKPLRMATNCA